MVASPRKVRYETAQTRIEVAPSGLNFSLVLLCSPMTQGPFVLPFVLYLLYVAFAYPLGPLSLFCCFLKLLKLLFVPLQRAIYVMIRAAGFLFFFQLNQININFKS